MKFVGLIFIISFYAYKLRELYYKKLSSYENPDYAVGRLSIMLQDQKTKHIVPEAFIKEVGIDNAKTIFDALINLETQDDDFPARLQRPIFKSVNYIFVKNIPSSIDNMELKLYEKFFLLVNICYSFLQLMPQAAKDNKIKNYYITHYPLSQQNKMSDSSDQGFITEVNSNDHTEQLGTMGGENYSITEIYEFLM